MSERGVDNLCLVVPIFDHGPQFVRVWPALRQLAIPTIVVDDGSGLETCLLLQSLAAEEPLISLLRHERNGGKGSAVTTGLLEAHARGFGHAFQIDADGQHDLSAFAAFADASERAPGSLIAGYPVFDETITRARRWGRLLTTIWIWVETLSFKIRDGMCGFRIYPLARIVPLLQTRGLGTRMDFDIEILVRSRWAGIPIEQLPVETTYPPEGRSNFRMGADNLLITWMHTRLVIGMLLWVPSSLVRLLRRA